VKTKMRYLTTLLVATAATGAAVGFAPIAIADPGAVSRPQATRLGDAGLHAASAGFLTDQPAGGTGIDPGPDAAPDFEPGAGPALGQRAGGTGIDPGPSAAPDTPSGPGDEDGGDPAGGIG
jgi:hypothetical protein